jgi:branched-chain amino acid transport system permease protein
MLTLAFAQLLYAVAYKWTSVTGGSDGLAGPVQPEYLHNPQRLLLSRAARPTRSPS